MIDNIELDMRLLNFQTVDKLKDHQKRDWRKRYLLIGDGDINKNEHDNTREGRRDARAAKRLFCFQFLDTFFDSSSVSSFTASSSDRWNSDHEERIPEGKTERNSRWLVSSVIQAETEPQDRAIRSMAASSSSLSFHLCFPLLLLSDDDDFFDTRFSEPSSPLFLFLYLIPHALQSD